MRTSRNDPTRLECDILDFRPFERAVPFKDPRGNYLELHGTRKGYFQPGVRRITEDELTAILDLAQAAPAEAEVVAGHGACATVRPQPMARQAASTVRSAGANIALW